jgi:hypothetical protein
MPDTAITSTLKARTILLSVWISFFFINGVIILFLYFQNWIERDNFMAALKQLSVSYSPYLGAIFSFYLAKRKKISEQSENKTTFALALICSLVWNILILVFLLPPLSGTGAIETSLQNINDTASLLSWLIAGAIGYYFVGIASG